MALDVVIALGAGVLSFLAPCTLPLLPAYVAVLSGSPIGVAAPDRTRRLIAGSVLYVAGFTAVFVALGVAAGSLGATVRATGSTAQRVGGATVLVLAVAMAVEARTGRVSALLPGRYTATAAGARSRAAGIAGPAGPLLLGVVFATAQTPCVGPVLAGVLTLAHQGGGALRGGVLLAAYAVGLGLPFVIVSLLVASSPSLVRRLATVAGPTALVGAGLLALLGVALLTGWYGNLAGGLAPLVPAGTLPSV